MSGVEIEEVPGTKWGVCCILRAPCATCGAAAEGRVAASRVDPDLTRAVAREWKRQVEAGEARLRCPRCRA